MPIYRQTYRSFEGGVRRHFRWWIMVEQELRVLYGSKIFFFLVLTALLHVLLRFLQLMAWDVVAQDPLSPYAAALKQIQQLKVDASTFFDFVRFQIPIVFIILLYAGSGMICNDFRNNLMEVYFSKPLTWRDYVLGKVLTLVLLGLALTALPGIVLVALHNVMLPGWATLEASWWWPLAILGFSGVIVLPTALGILASSALLQSQNFAAIVVFMLLFANSSMGGLLAAMLRDREYLVVAFPLVLHRLGQHFFGDHRLVFESHWGWSLLITAALCALCAAVVCRVVRRAEAAA